MDTFRCEGWLMITQYPESDTAVIRLTHTKDHVPYWCIDVPAEVRELVTANGNLKTAEVSTHQSRHKWFMLILRLY